MRFAKQHELLIPMSATRRPAMLSPMTAFRILPTKRPAPTEKLHFSLSDGERGVLMLIDESFARIKEGNYGKCTNCGNTIGEKRFRPSPGRRTASTARSSSKRGCCRTFIRSSKFEERRVPLLFFWDAQFRGCGVPRFLHGATAEPLTSQPSDRESCRRHSTPSSPTSPRAPRPGSFSSAARGVPLREGLSRHLRRGHRQERRDCRGGYEAGSDPRCSRFLSHAVAVLSGTVLIISRSTPSSRRRSWPRCTTRRLQTGAGRRRIATGLFGRQAASRSRPLRCRSRHADRAIAAAAGFPPIRRWQTCSLSAVPPGRSGRGEGDAELLTEAIARGGAAGTILLTAPARAR